MESAHALGYPLVPSPTPPTFQTDCAWAGAQCAVLNTATVGFRRYFKLPTVNLGALSADMGFSICTWFVIDATISSVWGRIFDFGNGPGNNNIILTQNAATSSLHLFQFCGNSGSSIAMSKPFVYGQWQHICVVNQGASWKFYQDGALTGSHQFSCAMSNVDLISNYIGEDNWGGASNMMGKVDEFRLYKGELSAAEAAAVYTSRGPRLVNQ